MGRPRRFYLNLGSNIMPESNLSAAIARLRAHGDIENMSSVWESGAVGSPGPNFLNICVGFAATLDEAELRHRIVLSIETALGRQRGNDRHSPRTIDIDVMMVDGKPRSVDSWRHAFVIVPMAELLPHFVHPVTMKTLAEAALEAQATTWIVRRPDVLKARDG